PAGLRPSRLTFGVTSACPMLAIWWLTYLARAGLSPAGIIDLARPHTLLVLLLIPDQINLMTTHLAMPCHYKSGWS
ncbi:MAG: hypothetical protein HOK14_02230, partial [Gammaproteobacteria bacterium]|nr:hypothetical protein [Gammaproteobacteria bacterium]